MSAPSRKISAALAAGCSIIIKPAEETPATACLFAQCFLDAGLPKGVLNLVFGDPAEISTTLIRSPIIRMVTLTGSVGVGKQLTLLAAEGMKPVLMELGGHAPVLIDENVDAAAIGRLAVGPKFLMAGQYCACPTRYLVHRKVYDDFVGAFAEEASKLKVGDGFAEGVQMGPVIHRRRLETMASLVEDAVQHGARVVTGGERVGNRGYFFAPTVLADVPLEAAVMSVEPFGPLAACRPIDNLEEGLAIANGLPVGLAAYAFTNSLEKADWMSRELQAGSVAINVFRSPGNDAPFGGYKESGIGREGGEEFARLLHRQEDDHGPRRPSMTRVPSPSAPALLEDLFGNGHGRHRIRPPCVERQMGYDLGGLLLGQAVVHRAVEVEGNLRHLAGRDQSGDCDEAAIARREVRAQPQIAEEIVRRVFYEAGRNRAELAGDSLRPPCLRRLVQRKRIGVDRRELVCRDTVSVEDLADRADRGHGLAPSGIVGEMRDRLRDFPGLHPVFERLIRVVDERPRLAARN